MTDIICVDANFVVLLLSLQPSGNPFEELWNSWQDSCKIIAPSLFSYEVANAFHRAAKAGQISQSEAQRFLETALDLDITFYGDPNLHKQALKIAQRFNLSASYDAHYLALTERMNAEFWTADARLFNSVRSLFNWIHLVTPESSIKKEEK
jgi:predicted nucleic acid-binding protein